MAERSMSYDFLDDLVPAPDNEKGHAEGLIGASLDRFGLVEVPVVDERTGLLLAGHGRVDVLRAAFDEGEEPPEGVIVESGRWKIPVIHGVQSVDDIEAAALRIALNQVGPMGGWDDAALAASLSAIAESTYGFVGVGYDAPDLSALLISVNGYERHLPDVDPDDTPEPPVAPITQPGDLWLLGPHRLLCGDARIRADYDRVLNKDLAGAVVSDPPYGVGIGAKNRALDEIDRADRVLTDLEGDQGVKEVEELWRAAFGLIFDVIPPGCPYYINGPQGGELGLLLLLLLREAKLDPRHILIWVKNQPSFSLGRLDYDYQHEPIVYGWKPGAAHPWYATESRQSVMMIDRPQASPDHPTMKPVALLTPLISNSTRPGAVILDPFGGSGSTLIAADMVGRVARLLELAPGYCDVICRRYQGLTGVLPVLESTGETIDFHSESLAR